MFADAVSNGNVRILRVSIEHGKLLSDLAVAVWLSARYNHVESLIPNGTSPVQNDFESGKMISLFYFQKPSLNTASFTQITSSILKNTSSLRHHPTFLFVLMRRMHRESTNGCSSATFQTMPKSATRCCMLQLELH